MAGKHAKGKQPKPGGAGVTPPKGPPAAGSSQVAGRVAAASAASAGSGMPKPGAPVVDEYGLPLDDGTIREEIMKQAAKLTSRKVALGPVVGAVVVLVLLTLCVISRAGTGRQANAAFDAGIRYFDLGDYPQAAKSLQQAVALDPSNAKAQQMLGWSLDATDDLKGAAEHYEAYLRLSPGNAEVWYNLGSVYRQRKDYKNAVRCFTKALKLNPDYVSAAGELGDMYVATRQYDLAIQQYRHIITLSHSNVKIAELHVAIGSVFAKAGNRPAAVQEWKLALRIDPTSTKARTLLRSR